MASATRAISSSGSSTADDASLLFHAYGLFLSSIVFWKWLARRTQKRNEHRLTSNIPRLTGSRVYGSTFDYLSDIGAFDRHYDELETDVFYSFMMGRDTINVRGHENLKQLFGQTQESKLGPGWTSSVESLLGSEAILAATGAAHKRMRHSLISSISPPKLKLMAPSMARVVWDHVDRWISSTNNNGRYDLAVEVPKMTLHAMMDLALGPDFCRQHLEDLSTTFDEFTQGLFAVAVPLPFTTYGRAQAANKRMRRLFQDEIDVRRKGTTYSGTTASSNGGDGGCTKTTTLLDQYIDQGLKDYEIADTLINTMLAAFAPTTSLLLTALEQLALDETNVWHDKLRAELKEHLDLDDSSPAETVVGRLGDMLSLPFLASYVKEAGLYRPVTPAVWRRATSEITLETKRNGTVVIPKGYYVHISMAKTMAGAFFPRPANEAVNDTEKEFQPERFLGKQPSLIATGELKYQYLVFGAGGRMCPGYRLASLQIAMVVAIVALRTKEIRLANNGDGGESGGPQWKHMPAPGPVGGLLVEHRST